MDLENTKKWLLGNNIYMDICNLVEQAGAKVVDYKLRMTKGDVPQQYDYYMGMKLMANDQALKALSPIWCYPAKGWPVEDEQTQTLAAIAALINSAGCEIAFSWRHQDPSNAWSRDVTSIAIAISVNDLDAGLRYYAEQDVPAPEEQTEVMEALEGLKAYYGGLPNDGGRKYVKALTEAISALRAEMMGGRFDDC